MGVYSNIKNLLLYYLKYEKTGGFFMDKQWLIVVHNGLNEEQYAYIERLKKEGFQTSFHVFPEGHDEEELAVVQEVIEKIKDYQAETNCSPHVLLAVSVGEFIIPEVTKLLDKEYVIHVDERGNRFAY
jgi:hypothetical protein